MAVERNIRGGQGVWFTLLGPVRAWFGPNEVDLGTPQQRSLLALLILRAGSHVSLAECIAALWDDAAPSSAGQTIRTYICRLRKRFAFEGAPAIIDSSRDGYAITVGPEDYDLGVFRQRLAVAKSHSRASNPVAAAENLRHALSLWRGEPLTGILGSQVRQQRLNLASLRLDALESLFAFEVDGPSLGPVIREISDVVAEYPLDERFRRLLILALYRSGRRTEALEVYRQTQELLAHELGVDPGWPIQVLHQKILERGPDPASGSSAQTISSVSAARLRGSTIPAQLPHEPVGFIGRVVESTMLDRLLSPGGEATPGAVLGTIHGMAGVGKTTLAVHWARRVADRFPDGQVFLDLRGFDPSDSPMDTVEALRIMFASFGVPPEQIPIDLAAQCSLYRSLLAGKRLLVVLDNARDAAQVRPLLPAGTSCLTIVTSRNQLAGLVALDQARSVKLDVLTERESRAFLAGRIEGDRVMAEPHAVEELVSLCERLPLALAIVAARAVLHPEYPLSRISKQLRADHGTLEAFSDPEAAIDLRAVLSWSYRQLSPEAARLFRLLALHPGQELTIPAAARLIRRDVAQTRSLAAELSQIHLICEPTHGRFRLHDLVQAYAGELTVALDTEHEGNAARPKDG